MSSYTNTAVTAYPLRASKIAKTMQACPESISVMHPLLKFKGHCTCSFIQQFIFYVLYKPYSSLHVVHALYSREGKQ